MLSMTTTHGSVPLLCDDYYVKELSTGLDELIFTVSIWDPNYKDIQEETEILEQSDGASCRYLVKAIDGGDQTAQIKCVIDLDEWNAAFTPTYEITQLNVGEVVQGILPPGWTMVNDSYILTRRSMTLEGVTPAGILDVCRDAYPGVTYRFDNVGKVITLENLDGGQNLGAFATRELNLIKSNYKGKSTDIVTRLYPYGKDGLTIAEVNDGKAYIDNQTYLPRVICAYWKDERYTDAGSLFLAATQRLAELAIPQRSYDLEVIDLAATDPEKYDFLSFPLFSRVSLIDETRSAAKIIHRVIQRWRYPYHPEKNRVTLATVAPRLQTQVMQIVKSLNNANSEYNLSRTAEQVSAIERVTADILGAKGGAVRLLDTDGDGQPDEIYVADNADPAQAHYVWRWNYAGWGASKNGYNGPFTMAATIDSGIVADYITAGTLNADRIGANSIAVSKLTGSIGSGDWEIDLTNGTMTIGTLAVGKITGSVSGGSGWSINFDTGTMTIGRISADNITAGTINADSITVTNINGQNIKASTIGSLQLGDESVVNRVLGGSSVSNAKVLANTLTSGSMSSGVQTSLAGGDLADSCFNYGVEVLHGAFSSLTIRGQDYIAQQLPQAAGGYIVLAQVRDNQG